jgi:hypothetical protein
VTRPFLFWQDPEELVCDTVFRSRETVDDDVHDANTKYEIEKK